MIELKSYKVTILGISLVFMSDWSLRTLQVVKEDKITSYIKGYFAIYFIGIKRIRAIKKFTFPIILMINPTGMETFNGSPLRIGRK